MAADHDRFRAALVQIILVADGGAEAPHTALENIRAEANKALAEAGAQ
ncbi:hypothetical protein FHR83_006788 [Actinoplanes campanulatus]|uniref:Uncharacterized protein n=2 Tax=Actinoplanes campanulatus TaxID=113559 RepID=A0A7W5AN19_9ACTN|nr:hypothetical protein [Actinoplanes campanulatus]MBB3099082.1 hypothetical protein [Actinoplanes campanulatus]